MADNGGSRVLCVWQRHVLHVRMQTLWMRPDSTLPVTRSSPRPRRRVICLPSSALPFILSGAGGSSLLSLSLLCLPSSTAFRCENPGQTVHEQRRRARPPPFSTVVLHCLLYEPKHSIWEVSRPFPHLSVPFDSALSPTPQTSATTLQG
jgi:hypothetical protein